MPKGKPKYCDCGCGVTPSTYREKFFEAWPTGYPYQNTGLYYCGNYGNTNDKGYTCNFVDQRCSKAHVDHVFPKAKGGLDCINNLRIMCSYCNESKNDKETKTAKLSKFMNASHLRAYQKIKIKQ